MRWLRRGGTGVLVALLLAWTAAVPAASGATKRHDCLRIMYVGQCFWLACAGPYCTTESSAKIGHYAPDLVITVTNGTAQGGIEVGTPNSPHRAGEQGYGRKTNLSYRSAQAVGHPLADLGYCPSEATPLQPYFLSTLDETAWDWSYPEVLYPQSLVPGLREIGDWPRQSWGAVYPRSGWSLQAEEPKAAAIAAQRVGDLVTRSGQPHIYLALESGGTFTADNKLVWRPQVGLNEDDAQGGDFELTEPSSDPGQCQTFGANDLPGQSAMGWSAGKLSKTGDYAYTLWRPYTCCEIKGTYLFEISIPYPP
jgi:integrating conjugative element protein (TIGR03756 family)